MKKKFLIGICAIGIILAFSGRVLEAAPPSATAPGTTTYEICSNNSMRNVTGIVNWASCFLLKVIVPFLFALATVAFIWGVIQYYLNPDNEEKRKKGRSFIIGGLIALFVMLSMWGLVGIFTGTFQLSNTIPQLPGQ